MVDIHSHILPGIDDGSRDPQESLGMLAEMMRQGFDTVAATSHFYIQEGGVERFLEQRATALERLMEAASEEEAELPEIRPGAEVYYFNGISKLEDLPKLRIEGSKLLLLEMPNSTWSDYTIREMTSLNHSGSMQILLAHVERCLPFQKSKVAEQLLADGFLFQMNAGPFLSGFSVRHKALKDVKAGKVHFLGSDAHGLRHRRPELGTAMEVIEKKCGPEILREMDDRARYWLGQDQA